MARIRDFEQVTSKSKIHPTEADAEWNILSFGPDTLLQVSTFGSDSRASHPKVSQTIQFDLNAARTLKEAIETAFPEL
ncbi:hypothetical protein [Mycetocola sp. JXN-3]|uniref:hypothetical protein n=1 Tax=Mycetocola sp. JXN-3 TaxID=2116510 RepID=UPI00165CF0BE|nr:hypothetical protein [Mycetocola sp. JXN-3]